MARWSGLLLVWLAGCQAQGSAGRGCTCRLQIYCAGAFDSLQEMAESSCQLEDGRRGLCCEDTEKGKAPPKPTFELRGSDERLTPKNLDETDWKAKLAAVKEPSAPQATKDKETQSHRLFTKGRREDDYIRKAALRLLQVVDEFESEGISLRSAQDGFDARNSIAVEDLCPWTNKKRPLCGNTNTRSGKTDRLRILGERTVDGSCNNLEQPLWGMSSTPQQRIIEPPAYSQPGSRPRVARSGRPLPSARLASTTAFTTGMKKDTANVDKISTLFMQMGQFIDHDVTHSPATPPAEKCCDLQRATGLYWDYPSDQELRAKSTECFPIEIPRNDPFWGLQGRTCMEFSRADPSPSIPKCSSSEPRSPMNAITHWLDASNVYGSTKKETVDVRDTQERFGFLKMTPSETNRQGRGFLPQCAREAREAEIEACSEIREDKARQCVFAGDFRVNEQPGLSMIHTLWMREHNRIAEQLSNINTHWDPEKVFQQTRRIVIAVWQNIIYNEWLPILLGQQFMKSFRLFPLKPGQGYAEDYDSSIDPRINAEFSGAAFRFGHSMVPGLMNVKKQAPQPRSRSKQVKSQFRLNDVFNNPSLLSETGFLDGIVRGQSLTEAPAVDAEFTQELTNRLFEKKTDGRTEEDRREREGGLDLTSLNIQRGRDLGLQGYNSYRKICRSGKYREVASFDELARDGYLSRESVERLRSLYDHVDDIDLFVGGMLESHHGNAVVGPTFLCIIGDQFTRFKRADRFWFENGNDRESRFTVNQLNSLRSSSMARVICDNTGLDEIQPFAFRVETGPANSRMSCQDANIPSVDLSLWRE